MLFVSYEAVFLFLPVLLAFAWWMDRRRRYQGTEDPMRRDLMTLALGGLVAMATFVVLSIASPMATASLGAMFPMFVAWAAGSTFALSRQPRHGWVHVAALGLLVAVFVSGYFGVLRILYPMPQGFSPGGPNMPPPGMMPPQ